MANNDSGNGGRGAQPQGSALYEVLKGIDFERRELVDKSKGVGLFDLVKAKDGSYRCYSCTLCERVCPVDCIEIDYCPEFEELPFDVAAERAAALATLPGESCGAGAACVMGEKPAGFVPDIDMKLFDPVVAKIRDGSGLVEAFHATQEAFGYLPRVALEDIAEEMKLPFSRVFGVASFYSQFRLLPVGKHVIDVCMGTACHVAGAPLVVEALSQELEVPVGGTTADGLFTLQTVNCVGACALAPVVRLGDDETFGRLGPNEARKLVRKLRKMEVGSMTPAARATRFDKALKAKADKSAYLADDAKTEIRICAGTACHASGRVALRTAVEKTLAERGLADRVAVVETGCHGFCEEGPIVVVRPQGLFYPRLKPGDIAEIIATSVVGDGVVERLLYKDPQTGEALAHEKDIAFYALQERIVLALNGKIDPFSLDDYLSHGGYTALATVLNDADPQALIDEVEKSGLRGRGGAGFPTGKKWRFCRANPGEKHYVICNADEGDPGAFMDRSVLEGNPHSVIEGMIIAAYAIGAGNGPVEGYVYVRHEYPFAVQRLRHALETARARNLLGDDILGSGFSFDIRINQGAGAFVCGESTALTASIEGHRGMPRGKHIRTVAHGLWGQPTNLNNVESYANVPWIVNHGAEAFSAKGTATSKGTKIFSLTGKVVNGGLIEVPMGATLRQVIFAIGGGMLPGREFKAVQLGGPSGGCLPASLLDEPIDFESLVAAGSMMGSGGMVVVDDTTCMVDFAKFFLKFTAEESCGKCVPCRVGTQRMLEILERISAGEATLDDVDRLEQLADDIIEGSLCQLGGSAPNPVLSTLRYFRDEVMAHVVERRCPAKVCRPLIRYTIDADACTGCHVCLAACPTKAISGERKQLHTIDQKLCIQCDTCRQVCKFDAIPVETGIFAMAEGRRQ